MKRKTRKVMWIVFYHGPGSTNVTMDMQSAWYSKRAALAAIDRMSGYQNYHSVEKYLRAEYITPKPKGGNHEQRNG
jgi:hypothetical protein